MFARSSELTSEESLIYVNHRLLVCQVADQRRFTVGVEGGFESSRAFSSRLGERAPQYHPPTWMFESANRWHSDKWWLGLFVWLVHLGFPWQSDRDLLFRTVDVWVLKLHSCSAMDEIVPLEETQLHPVSLVCRSSLDLAGRRSISKYKVVSIHSYILPELCGPSAPAVSVLLQIM